MHSKICISSVWTCIWVSGLVFWMSGLVLGVSGPVFGCLDLYLPRRWVTSILHWLDSRAHPDCMLAWMLLHACMLANATCSAS